MDLNKGLVSNYGEGGGAVKSLSHKWALSHKL